MIPIKLLKLLKKHKVDYEVLMHPETWTASETAERGHLPGREVAKVVMVKIKGSDAMVVIPSCNTVDLLKLSVGCGSSDIRVEDEKEFEDLFPDCETGAMPPFGKLYHLPCFVDESLKEVPEIIFRACTHRESLRIATEDFLRIVKAESGDFSVVGKKIAV
jgi:Ala-tRNA(Pro) deacylase